VTFLRNYVESLFPKKKHLNYTNINLLSCNSVDTLKVEQAILLCDSVCCRSQQYYWLTFQFQYKELVIACVHKNSCM